MSESEVVETMNNCSQGLLYKPNNVTGYQEEDVDSATDIKTQIMDKIQDILTEYPYQQKIQSRIKYFTPQTEKDFDFNQLTNANLVDLRIDPVLQISEDTDAVQTSIKEKQNVLQKVRLLGNSDKVYIGYIFMSDLLKNKTEQFYKHAMNPGLYSNRDLIENSTQQELMLELLPKQSFFFEKLEDKYSPEAGTDHNFNLHFFCCQLGKGNFRRNLKDEDNLSKLEDLENLDLITKFEKMTMNLEGVIREFLRYGKAVPKYGA